MSKKMTLANSLLASLNNREIAVLIWISVGIALILIHQKLRPQILSLFKQLLWGKLGLLFWLMCFYSLLIVLAAYKLGAWQTGLLKDTLIWFFGTAVVLFVSLDKAKRTPDFFKKSIVSNLELAALLVFLMNLHVFNLVVELLLLPCLLFLAMLSAVADMDAQFKPIKKALDFVFMIIGFAGLIYVVLAVLNYSSSFDVLETLTEFFLPILLTVALIPCLYTMAFIIEYELLFVRIERLFKNKTLLRKIRLKAITYSQLRLSRLRIFSEMVNSLLLLDNEDDMEKSLEGF